MEKILNSIDKFETFTKSEIASALSELKKIKSEKNRKHLQRLVYVNLVNRFDTLVDTILIFFSTRQNTNFSGIVLSKVKETPVYLKDIYEILLSDQPTESVKRKVEEIVKIEFLSSRHSRKLRTLLKNCFNWKDTDLERPRVNLNDGRIHNDVTKRNEKIPASVIGYADWLYSRRNALVHSDKLTLLQSDLKHLTKAFGVKDSKFVGIKLSSIESASTFYMYLCQMMKDSL